jgi:5-(carboxyamino)imidazole ribonucleotide mutase
MNAQVSIIMGSTSDLPIMEKAAKVLDELEIPFEMHALSAHRTPEAVEEFAKNAHVKGIKVIIAGAGMAAHLPGVIASMTCIPIIGVPIKASLEGLDALLSIVQMPPGRTTCRSNVRHFQRRTIYQKFGIQKQSKRQNSESKPKLIRNKLSL